LNQGSVASFQRDIYEKSIPSPSTDAILPVGALTSEEINELLSGNTVEGENWIEHYAEDGSIQGIDKTKNVRYAGLLQIKDSFFCYYYPTASSPNISDCLSIRKEGNIIFFYTLDGNLRTQGTEIDGNPKNL